MPSTLSPHNAAHIYRRRSFIARHTPFTAYESPTHKPHITISITIIALFIVELVDAAGLLGAVRGLQIFYTRTSPSRSFDLLSDDFDYVVLLLMITGLATLTGSFWWWSKNKDLASAWR